MKDSSLRELFVDELRDLYDAENRLIKALPKLAKKASFQAADLIRHRGNRLCVSEYSAQVRATIVTTREGRDVVIPNVIIFTSPVAAAYGEPQNSQQDTVKSQQVVETVQGWDQRPSVRREN